MNWRRANGRTDKHEVPVERNRRCENRQAKQRTLQFGVRTINKNIIQVYTNSRFLLKTRWTWPKPQLRPKFTSSRSKLVYRSELSSPFSHCFLAAVRIWCFVTNGSLESGLLSKSASYSPPPPLIHVSTIDCSKFALYQRPQFRIRSTARTAKATKVPAPNASTCVS